MSSIFTISLALIFAQASFASNHAAEIKKRPSNPPVTRKKRQLKETNPLVDATTIVKDLALDIRYATDKNFTKTKLYDSDRCFLRPRVAAKLAKAQEIVRRQGFRLKVFDCYRPFSVQKKMWAIMPVRGLVAPPALGGSNHNRGAAVDVSLERLDGKPLEMPTDYDYFGKAARSNSMAPSANARKNRSILQKAMTKAGFKMLYEEWWHFSDLEALQYRVLDVHPWDL